MVTRLYEINLDTVLWRVLAQDDVSDALVDLDDAELHRLARAADALAQLCYGLAAPRADVLPAVPDGGGS